MIVLDEAFNLNIERLTPHIGAVIHDIDLTQCNEDEFQRVYQAFLAHQVIFFHDQCLTPQQHLSLAAKFGVIEPPHPFFPHAEGAPQISVIEIKRGAPPLESDWHTDLTWRETPSTCSLLHAQHVPDVGGDTLWCSMSAVFEKLDASLQQRLRQLSAQHSLVAFENVDDSEIELDWQKRVSDVSKANPPVSHPMVKIHPETGKETLFINEQFTRKIEGLSTQESNALLAELFSIARQPEFQVRFRWQPNALAIWDNRVTQHYAVIDYGDEPRKLHRVTVV